MHKLFATLATLAGGLAILLAAWLFFNRTNTVDAMIDAREARIELQQINFDENFDRQMGNPQPPEQLQANARRRNELQTIIAAADQQRVAAAQKRQAAEGLLDRTLADLDSGAIKPASNDPGMLSYAIAGLILLSIGVGLRFATRKESAGDDQAAAAPVRLADQVIDRVGRLFGKSKKVGGQ